jgi:hypothetical protein
MYSHMSIFRLNTGRNEFFEHAKHFLFFKFQNQLKLLFLIQIGSKFSWGCVSKQSVKSLVRKSPKTWVKNSADLRFAKLFAAHLRLDVS